MGRLNEDRVESIVQKLKGVKRHPTIGDHVTLYSGSSILGGETVIEENVVVGGNTFSVIIMD